MCLFVVVIFSRDHQSSQFNAYTGQICQNFRSILFVIAAWLCIWLFIVKTMTTKRIRWIYVYLRTIIITTIKTKNDSLFLLSFHLFVFFTCLLVFVTSLFILPLYYGERTQHTIEHKHQIASDKLWYFLLVSHILSQEYSVSLSLVYFSFLKYMFALTYIGIVWCCVRPWLVVVEWECAT